MQPTRGIKGFLASRPGLVVLGLIAVGAMVGSFLYLGPFIAIPTLLLFGLAIPIYAGWKRPRVLVLFGIVVLLAAAPLATLADNQAIRAPSPAYASSTAAPYGNGGSVLQGALATPYTGLPGGVYEFTATVHPEYSPTNASTPLWVELFVSTCPGATGNSSPNCGSGYPFLLENESLPANLTAPHSVSFNVTLNGTNIWWWQMAAVVETPANSGNLTWIFLDVSNGYGAVQGPVTGDFAATYGVILLPITEVMFLYSGTVFLVGLLVYMFLKAREARRRRPPITSGGAPAGGPAAGGGSSETASASASPSPSPEAACPNCGAVVYPSESACWKCGAKLPAPDATPPSSAPLKGA